jgi:hypothetical protein
MPSKTIKLTCLHDIIEAGFYLVVVSARLLGLGTASGQERGTHADDVMKGWYQR